MTRIVLSFCMLAALFSAAALAQENPQSAEPEAEITTEGEGGGQSLEQAANDPTASLTSVQAQLLYISDYYTPSNAPSTFSRARSVVSFVRHPFRQLSLRLFRSYAAGSRDFDDESTSMQLRSAIPFKTGPLNHIARITVPVTLDSPTDDSGLSDMTLFDLIVFDRPWGRWGVGPVLLVPTATEDRLGADKWAIGPAVGFVARKGPLLAGIFNQNLFTFAGDDDRPDVNVSIVQPIVNYSLGNGWSVGSSEMNFTYDWEQDDWTNLPLGAKVSKLFRAGKTPVQVFGSAEHNFADDHFAPKWTFSAGVKVLF